MIMTLPSAIYFYSEAVDFRKQIDSLCLLVNDVIQMNPGSGCLFLFRNRQGNKIKGLLWDCNGFWLLYKRLEQGRFNFPIHKYAHVLELSHDQLQWLLRSVDLNGNRQAAASTGYDIYI